MTEKELVISCHRLVPWLARRLYPLMDNDPLVRAAGSFDDVCAEGHLALCRAARGYDPTHISARTGKPVKFSSYASRAVHNAMRDFVGSYHGLIRVPKWGKEKLHDYQQRQRRSPLVCLTDENLDWKAVQDDPSEYLDLVEALSKLRPEERKLLHQRFWEGKLLREVGEEAGVTRERIRQRLEKILNTLRCYMGEEAA